MKKKIINMLAVIVIALCATINFPFEKKDRNMNFHLFNTEALAQEENGQSQKGYLSNAEDCTVSERAVCTIDLQWIFGCTIDFEYTLNFPGRRDECQYTGGPTYCTPYACKKNGN